ncbi:hypothetical protein DFJ58DRAFT_735625 [Suillus subalutaceus]|uniref:uncharacterized protein n=1 Tax=Suillus subalutaceus TaxID=48586 RepID=UPI001B88657A|nr:uncharacterized protein DFJ58DRAFT_735625 [Suillus subalutaceus]KAG1835344.1 hypothetical protein DFJ58DRAFT_735625 [Suillus subalutaceus]
MPPAHCERARRSARLKANNPLHSRAMDDESTSQGPPKPPELSGPQLTIQWQNDRALTDTLVNYLVSKSADCRVLFYSDGKKAMTAVDDHPSGSDKGQIHQNIAKLLFANHSKYGAAYTINPKKFRDAVGNRIGTLRGKYKKIKTSFGSTGAGVMPAEGTQANNLLDAALLELPWYTDLDSIWHSNPSMAAVTHSSRLGVDHAGALYSLVQPRGGAGPPTHFGSTHQWSPQYSPSAQYYVSARAPVPPSARAPVLPSAPTPAPPSAPPAPPAPPSPPSPSHTTPYNMSPQFHLPGLPAPDYNFDYDDDNFNQEISGRFDAPLEDTLDHLDGDDMMVDGTTDCPPHVAGKKPHIAVTYLRIIRVDGRA